KGAAMSGSLGVAFAVSAALRRPLTRTIAILLFAEHVVARRLLADRWRHPLALSVFRTLSFGWGLLLLLSALQQLVMVVSVSPRPGGGLPLGGGSRPACSGVLCADGAPPACGPTPVFTTPRATTVAAPGSRWAPSNGVSGRRAAGWPRRCPSPPRPAGAPERR